MRMRTSLSQVVSSPREARFPTEVAMSLSNIVFSITPDQALMTACGNEEVGHGLKCERVFISTTANECTWSQDSYSAHIDYGNKDVVVQYNLSFNNEGGFAEVLGDNINCGFRYNISINDGYREDPEGLEWNKKGKIFWVSTFCGGTVRSKWGRFYNNTIYVDSTLNPEIYVWPEAGDITY